jgi:hypothetical protein
MSPLTLLAFSALTIAAAPSPKPSPTPEPGIYVEVPNDATKPLDKVDPAAMLRTGTKDLKKGIATTMLTGGMFGGGMKMAMIYAGDRAARRVPGNTWFQFHFDPKAAGAPAPQTGAPMDQAAAMAMMQQQMDALEAGGVTAGMPAGTRAPQDFVLLKLDVKKKEGERELTVGMDMKPKNAVTFRVRQLGPNSYRVAPEKPLPPGEYAFYPVPKQNGTGGGGQAWDFGVDPASN